MQSYSQDQTHWNDLISHLPNAHLLQSWEWAQVKIKNGWEALPVTWVEDGKVAAAAMILKRRIPTSGMAARISILYIPKGPILDWTNEPLRKRVLNDLQAYAKRQGAIFLKIDPDVELGVGIPGSEQDVSNKEGKTILSDLKNRGWIFSADQIQFRNTIMIDLSPPEEEMLSRMKQKTRYNIRLAGRKGVSIRVGVLTDLPLLYEMYAETSVRDGFVIRDESYYMTVWKSFMGAGMAQALIAEVEAEPVAGLMLFWFAERSYYLYGMSQAKHRDKMPNYLLQWEAIKRSKAAGCKYYDLWGAPDVFETGERMWGVFRFKQGLGGGVLRTIGAMDFAPRPLLYKLYSEIIPRILERMRLRGKSRTKQRIGA